jgi:hypothetical protein
MTSRLNRSAYDKLIDEDLAALSMLRPVAIDLGVRLELDHVIEVVKASPSREYEEPEEEIKGGWIEMTTCSGCGVEIPEDEVMLGSKKIEGTDLYEELCPECFEAEDQLG